MGTTSHNENTNNQTQQDHTGWQLADRYEFIRLLGTGGTSTVHLANDRLLSRQVAVKTILPSLADNRELRQRIERECRLHAAIGVHPNIVTLYDKIEEGGEIYLVMEYVQGEVLADLLSGRSKGRGNPLTVDDSVMLVRQVVEAIACIHDHDIIHRDIKTSNILVRRQTDGQWLAKLMDFGIACEDSGREEFTRLTRLGSSGPGTPVYMAPERIDRQKFGEVGPATDLYSVGVILYQLLSGTPPFRGTITEIFNGHLTSAVDLSRLGENVCQGLLDIIKKTLAKNPKERYADARELVAALDKVSAQHDHAQTFNPQESELTLPVIESSNRAVLESTLLALESKIMDFPLSEKGRSGQPLAIFLAAVLVFGILFLSAGFFAGSKNNASTSTRIAANSPGHDASMVEKVGLEQSGRGPLLENDEKPGSAMKVLQAARTSGQSAVTGSGSEYRLEENRFAAGRSDWQILESTAHKISSE